MLFLGLLPVFLLLRVLGHHLRASCHRRNILVIIGTNILVIIGTNILVIIGINILVIVGAKLIRGCSTAYHSPLSITVVD